MGDAKWGVTVPSHVLKKIKGTTTEPALFCLQLASVLFDESTLANSNVSGLNGRHPLNRAKMAAIKGTVESIRGHI